MQENHKKIAKNTIMLYIRMVVIMLIGFYTSRIALNLLGVESFGIYSSVMGAVGFFGILQTSLGNSTTRFITYELGTGDKKRLGRTFSNILFLYILLAAVILLISETAGIWFLNHKLVIPPQKIFAAGIVFQLCIITYLTNAFRFPYQALIIAHESMDVYAVINIAETLTRLILLLCLTLVDSLNLLIAYAFALLITSLLGFSASYFYARKNFRECLRGPALEPEISKPVVNFYLTDFYNSSSWVLQGNGVSILQNIYFGPVANAAATIASQVFSGINSLAENFLSALRPQVIKNYAAGNKKELNKIIIYGTEMSLLLLLIFSVPLFIEIEFVLKLWLKLVPPYTVTFIRIILLTAVIDILFNIIYQAVYATGRIKKLSFIFGTVHILAFAVSWLLYIYGFPAYSSYLAVLIGNTVFYIFLTGIAAVQIPDFSIREYAREILLKALLFAAVMSFPAFIIHLGMRSGWPRLIAVCSVTTISWGLLCLTVAFNSDLRKEILSKSTDFFKKHRGVVK